MFDDVKTYTLKNTGTPRPVGAKVAFCFTVYRSVEQRLLGRNLLCTMTSGSSARVLSSPTYDSPEYDAVINASHTVIIQYSVYKDRQGG